MTAIGVKYSFSFSGTDSGVWFHSMFAYNIIINCTTYFITLEKDLLMILLYPNRITMGGVSFSWTMLKLSLVQCRN